MALILLQRRVFLPLACLWDHTNQGPIFIGSMEETLNAQYNTTTSKITFLFIFNVKKACVHWQKDEIKPFRIQQDEINKLKHNSQTIKAKMGICDI